MKKAINFLSGLALLVIASQSVAIPSGPVLVGGCSTSDFIASTQCAGIYDPGNVSGQASIFTDPTFQSTFPGTWTELVKLEDPTWNTPNSLGFFITNPGTTAGEWEVNANAWDGFAQGEVIAILKAGTNAAAYEVDLDVTEGFWNITSTAWDGSDLSNFSFWTTESSVPEPSMLALLSVGVFGLVLSARRNRKI